MKNIQPISDEQELLYIAGEQDSVKQKPNTPETDPSIASDNRLHNETFFRKSKIKHFFKKLLVVASLLLLIAGIVFLGLSAYVVRDVRQSCESKVAKLEKYASVIESKIASNENYFATVEVDSNPTPVCYKGSSVLVAGRANQEAKTFEAATESIIANMKAWGLPVDNAFADRSKVNLSAAGYEVRYGSYMFSAKDYVPGITRVNFEVQLWLDELESTDLL